jgi:hypothetical protein
VGIAAGQPGIRSIALWLGMANRMVGYCILHSHNPGTPANILIVVAKIL